MATALTRAAVLLPIWLSLAAPSAVPTIWTVLTIDPKGDGRDPALADAAQLAYRYDKPSDLLWFRVGLFGKPNAEAFGVNIAIDTGSPETKKVNWWGSNKEFKFDRLVTAWVTRTGQGYSGTIGVTDADGATARKFTSLHQNNLQIRVAGDSILLGLKRTDITDTMRMNVIASVGSDHEWNDDIPNSRYAELDLSAPRPSRGLREIDARRNNLTFAPGVKTLSDAALPRIVRRGRGARALILVPGVYSGDAAFDQFIVRNESRYTFFVVTPPGLSGTPPRPLPRESASYGEFAWTRRLARDLHEVIAQNHLDRPILVTHGFPGSLAADDLALLHPEAIAGIIKIADQPLQFSRSQRNSQVEATPEERIAVVDDSWVRQWFKYVTPETWESNNYPAAMLANDPRAAERARKELEAVPLPTKIRYLAEFMATDHRKNVNELNVPMLALVPGFNETLLADPAYSWLKTMFQDPWSGFRANAHLEIVTIPEARALVLDDQPEATDGRIAAFVAAHTGRQLAERSEFVIRNVRVFDGLAVISRSDVWVRDGRIEAVGAGLHVSSGVREIDGTGSTVLPGVIDAHRRADLPFVKGTDDGCHQCAKHSLGLETGS